MIGKRLVSSVIAAAALLAMPLQAQFLYVSNAEINAENNIGGYSINATTGALAEINGSPFAAGTNTISLAIDPSGKFIYAPNRSAGVGVLGYTINATTGALTEVSGSPFAGVNYASSVTVDPTGRFVYVANLFNSLPFASVGSVSAYTINATTGALTEISGSPFDAEGEPFSVTVDPTGRFVYVANMSNSLAFPSVGSVSAYTINATTGALTEISGSPFAAGITADSVAIDPTGRFAYVANQGDGTEIPGNVSVYAIDATTGALTEINGSPFAAGTNPISVAIDPSGKFVYVVNAGIFLEPDGNVSVYAVNATTGALTEINGSPFLLGTNPTSVAFDPAGNFVYVANPDSHNIHAYTINTDTGALTEIGGSPFISSGFPFKLAVSHVRFAGTPGGPECKGQSVSALAQQYGGLAAAANALGYTSVQALRDAIQAFCQ